MIAVPLKTAAGLNNREHWRAAAKRTKAEKQAIAWKLIGVARPPIPCSVRLTRTAPSNGLDDDNLRGSLKAVRDAIADWLGVDDRHSKQVRYVYEQKRGPWGVTIEFGGPVEGAQFELLPVLPASAIEQPVALVGQHEEVLGNTLGASIGVALVRRCPSHAPGCDGSSSGLAISHRCTLTWSSPLMKNDQERMQPLGPALQRPKETPAPLPKPVAPGVVEIGGKWETELPKPGNQAAIMDEIHRMVFGATYQAAPPAAYVPSEHYIEAYRVGGE